MKTKRERIQVAVESDLKTEAEDILARFRHESNNCNYCFYKQVIEEGGLPFEVKVV